MEIFKEVPYSEMGGMNCRSQIGTVEKLVAPTTSTGGCDEKI